MAKWAWIQTAPPGSTQIQDLLNLTSGASAIVQILGQLNTKVSVVPMFQICTK